MKRSRFDNSKKKKSGYIWGIIIAIVVIAAGTGAFIYFDGKSLFTKSNEQNPPVVNVPSEEDVQQETKEETPTTEPEKSTVVVDEGGYAISENEVTEPTIIEGIIIANKKYPLPKDYNPGEVPEAVEAYKEMESAALKDGHKITPFSSFRSYEYQQTLYDKYVARDGKANADRYSARPGYSEHQTGLAFDIGEVGRQDLWLTEEFGETPAGQWLVNNAHKYGFILRYPKGKEEITGFMYESWHFRYLGKDIAVKVYESGLTLEEYLGIE